MNGKDATNELSYLILGAQAAIKLHTPSISLRYHDRISEKMMYAAMDVVRLGGGQPAKMCIRDRLQVQCLRLQIFRI